MWKIVSLGLSAYLAVSMALETLSDRQYNEWKKERGWGYRVDPCVKTNISTLVYNPQPKIYHTPLIHYEKENKWKTDGRTEAKEWFATPACTLCQRDTKTEHTKLVDADAGVPPCRVTRQYTRTTSVVSTSLTRRRSKMHFMAVLTMILVLLIVINSNRPKW